ncbi:hypothetical protein GGI17_005361 [Coemansia sp. S146]|nr:hypothetical protein GGI17_005361 [Coemansia sp. S146]
MLGYNTNLLAKELQFELDIAFVYSGNAFQLLSQEPYQDCIFPSVRKLIVNLTLDDMSYYDWKWDGGNYYTPRDHVVYALDTTANIAGVVQRVKQMVPAVSEVDVTPYDMTNNLFRRQNVYILDLVQQLFGIVEKHTTITHGLVPMLIYMDLEAIRDLVHFDYDWHACPDDVMQLIRRSARTLQFINIEVANADVINLVRDPNSGGYLEYLCLHTLKTRSFNDRVSSQAVISKDFVPFLQLLRLSVRLKCPFADDVFFRGNASKLEYLELSLYLETVSLLRMHRVFTPTSHPSLKCIKIRSPPSYMPSAFATVTECMQFVLSIAPGASVRTIPDLVKYPEDRTLALSMLKDHGCIQILSLPDMSLSL